MKKVNNIDRKLDNMLSESIKLSSKPKQQVNEGWFDIITQGALVISLILWAFQSRGYSLNGSGIKKLFSDIKSGWKTMRMDKELVAIVTKLSNDPEVLSAAKEKVIGPRGGARPQWESEDAFRKFLRTKISSSEYDVLKKYAYNYGKKSPSNGDWLNQKTYDTTANKK